VNESTKRSSVDCRATPVDGPWKEGAAAEGARPDDGAAEGWGGGGGAEVDTAVVESEARAQALSISRTAASQSKPWG
jgi:hypothetical protein